ncbi:unnamed protein product [Strongylus vulgaris]|uniref:Uncharacterized protein n=1 Tax=Strongylus vulgaris TaxID=40348 RepID=A0A3P7L536_STRVU|nr:unnamed protein product [Strongylus vulgaris]
MSQMTPFQIILKLYAKELKLKNKISQIADKY